VDLPRLQRVLPEPFSFAVMKGLSNYLCLRRFDEHSQQLEIAATKSHETERVRAWAATTKTGDRADLDGVPDSAPSGARSRPARRCASGNRCPYVERCFITQMRRRALGARVVVVNHHLFLADLALRSRWPDAQVLPPYELVVFDEAHQIEDIATEVFGVQVSNARLFALARDLLRAPAPPLEAGRVESAARRHGGRDPRAGRSPARPLAGLARQRRGGAGGNARRLVGCRGSAALPRARQRPGRSGRPVRTSERR
jgi:Rad3-related DNA helicase